MKYMEYLAVLLWTIIRKVLGLVMIYVALPFRKYARNVVYNYVLQNGIYLQRLLERPMVEYTDYWQILSYHGTDGGYVRKRKVSWLEYKLVYWLIWGWLDDDSNDDTFDYEHVERLRNEGTMWRYLLDGCKRNQYGNSFDLGNARQNNFHFWATTLWTWRNTAYNFRYMQWEKKAGDKNIWLYEVSVLFGWLKDENKDNYSLVAFGWR